MRQWPKVILRFKILKRKIYGKEKRDTNYESFLASEDSNDDDSSASSGDQSAGASPMVDDSEEE